MDVDFVISYCKVELAKCQNTSSNNYFFRVLSHFKSRTSNPKILLPETRLHLHQVSLRLLRDPLDLDLRRQHLFLHLTHCLLLRQDGPPTLTALGSSDAASNGTLTPGSAASGYATGSESSGTSSGTGESQALNLSLPQRPPSSHDPRTNGVLHDSSK